MVALTRAEHVAAIAAAEHRLAIARALVKGWRETGIPVADGAVVRAQATVDAARAALAQHDARS